MTRVKICGLTRESDVDAAVAAGVDAVGVVCDVPVDTPREVSAERAAELLSRVPPFVSTVLVTMPETPEQAVSLVETVAPDAIQLHDDMPPEAVETVARGTDARVIKAVDAAHPEDAARFDGIADALLVDSVGENGAGGTGRTHDWERTADLVADLASPLVLAGGLTPQNVAEAVDTVAPFAVDVSSGVETTPGSKDHDAVAAFVRSATRGAVPVR